jgi:hypothetical protein
MLLHRNAEMETRQTNVRIKIGYKTACMIHDYTVNSTENGGMTERYQTLESSNL